MNAAHHLALDGLSICLLGFFFFFFYLFLMKLLEVFVDRSAFFRYFLPEVKHTGPQCTV